MIDLQPFCIDADSYRQDLTSPFTRGEFTYATNGHIMLRVPKRALYEAVPGPDGDLSKVTDDIVEDDPSALATSAITPAALASLPRYVKPGAPEVQCDLCMGSGYMLPCSACAGEGEIACKCLDCGDEHSQNCKECAGVGVFASSEDKEGHVDCDRCDGGGILVAAAPHRPQVEFAGAWYDPAYLDMIAALPNAAMLAPGVGARRGGDWYHAKPLRFRFDGGVGLLMPMTPPPEKKAEAA